MEEHDQYESLGLDDSMEDERDLDQIMADRRAAEVELDTRDVQVTNRKLPQLLHDQGGFFISIVSLNFIFHWLAKLMSMYFMVGLGLFTLYMQFIEFSQCFSFLLESCQFHTMFTIVLKIITSSSVCTFLLSY